LSILLFVTMSAVVLVGGFLYLNRSQLVVVDAPLPAGFPENGFSHAEFEALLQEYVDPDGNVAYEQWNNNQADRDKLDSYLAAVALYSPENARQRFPRRSNALAYWLYGYNAYVIHSVLEHWPLESVTDVKAPIEAVKGLGFFYRQRFLFGGAAYSLYAVEHDKILDKFKDPRIHFVLNCASDSCPVLRPELPAGDALEGLLVSSTAEFINDPRNVRVDHSKKQIVLSTIFKWYRNDFVNDLRRRGLSTERGVVGYISEVASTTLQDDISRAADYELVFADYDWGINNASH
jgi:uncharacterized protein DUF547